MKKKLFFSTTQIILLSFLAAILLGSVLLSLPVCSADHRSVSYVDALFTATTSVCVTGLVTLPTVSAWSTAGQIVILVLIQIGGLGVITILSGVMIGLHQKMNLRDRILLQDAFNLHSLSGILEFLKKVLIGTFTVEAIGALLCMIVFVPQYGSRGVWISVFHSVSAFCNAGMDILSENSLCDYATHPLIQTVTCALIILGSLGYIVWWDIGRVLKNFRKQKTGCFRHLTLHSKIVLSTTAFLLVGGTLAFFVLESNNPRTMQGLPISERWQLSFFQSVTTRTAGFASLPQQDLTNASALVSLLLMFIGGSPAGTAGGIKTSTAAVLFCTAAATIRQQEDTVLFHRTIPRHTIRKAIAVTGISFLTVFISTLLLAAVTEADMLDILYETVSAAATVGLTRALTAQLSLAGKLLIVATMYLGRVGPISIALAFTTNRQKQNRIRNPLEEISVG